MIPGGKEIYYLNRKCYRLHSGYLCASILPSMFNSIESAIEDIKQENW